MKKILSFLILFSFGLLLTACNTTPRKESAGAGMAVGAAMGATTGNPFAVAAGAAAGAAIGYHVNTNGKPPAALTSKPVVAVKKPEVPHFVPQKPLVTAEAKPEATPANPTTNSNKPILIKRTILKTSSVITYQDQNYCKQYKAVMEVEGRREEKLGIACKQPSGKWRTMT